MEELIRESEMNRLPLDSGLRAGERSARHLPAPGANRSNRPDSGSIRAPRPVAGATAMRGGGGGERKLHRYPEDGARAWGAALGVNAAWRRGDGKESWRISAEESLPLLELSPGGKIWRLGGWLGESTAASEAEEPTVAFSDPPVASYVSTVAARTGGRGGIQQVAPPPNFSLSARLSVFLSISLSFYAICCLTVVMDFSFRDSCQGFFPVSLQFPKFGSLAVATNLHIPSLSSSIQLN